MRFRLHLQFSGGSVAVPACCERRCCTASQMLNSGNVIRVPESGSDGDSRLAAAYAQRPATSLALHRWCCLDATTLLRAQHALYDATPSRKMKDPNNLSKLYMKINICNISFRLDERASRYSTGGLCCIPCRSKDHYLGCAWSWAPLRRRS